MNFWNKESKNTKEEAKQEQNVDKYKVTYYMRDGEILSINNVSFDFLPTQFNYEFISLDNNLFYPFHEIKKFKIELIK